MTASRRPVGILSDMRPTSPTSIGFVLLSILAATASAADNPATALSSIRLSWKDDYLTLSAPGIPGGPTRIHYLEAYCRPASTYRQWQEPTIGPKTRPVS